jgi:hypothetical protein
MKYGYCEDSALELAPLSVRPPSSMLLASELGSQNAGRLMLCFRYMNDVGMYCTSQPSSRICSQ